MWGHGQKLGLFASLGRGRSGTGHQAAHEHQRQTNANEGKAEGGKKRHANNQCFEGRGDALGNRRAVAGGMQGVVRHQFLAQTQGQPGQQTSGERAREETQRPFTGRWITGLDGGFGFGH